MDPRVEAFLRSWPWEPWPLTACALAVVVYYRGWRILLRRGSTHFSRRQLAAFLAGMAAVALALCSPLEPYAGLLLSVHMAQHLLLVFVAPPLIWLAAPQLPLMQGLPPTVLEHWLVPLLRWPVMQRLVRLTTHPVGAWLALTLMLWFWHVPRFYELALASDFWHRVEHICLLTAALLFWWPVVQPYPSQSVWPRAAVLPYLFLAAMQATALCAILTFAERPLYPHYALVPRVWPISAVTDQAIAGAIMWIAGLLATLVPVAFLGPTLLYVAHPSGQGKSLAVLQRGRRFPEPGIEGEHPAGSLCTGGNRATSCADQAPAHLSIGFDLLRTPFLGRLLCSAVTRRALQMLMLIAAAAIVVDGLVGPQTASLNLAGVLPWVHWRGLLVLVLLVGGNFLCMACPFTLPRAMARRWWSPRWEWPAAWRSKWLAVGLLIVFFWAYEALDLWASPWWTAWIVVGYFVAALAVDMVFRGAAFCKYVCPVGQFQFVQSLMSPLTVRVRDPETCTTCRTKECIQGGPQARGCELQLFVPRKTSNLDCTFCLDCVRGCPVANVGLLASLPGAALVPAAHPREREKSFARPDVAALILLLVSAAFANAAGMIAPVVIGLDRVAAAFGVSRMAVESGYLLLALVVVPLVAVFAVGAGSRLASKERQSVPAVVTRFATALVPLGAAMWLAHYGFHLATGAAGCVAASVRFLGDWGLPLTGGENLVRHCCAIEPPAWLVRAEILCLDLGLLAALYLAYRTATARHPEPRRAVGAFLPWGLLLVALFLLGVWILLQPMEMRGTFSSSVDSRMAPTLAGGAS